jgi:beta-glucan synthesis-associated protein KRE6
MLTLSTAACTCPGESHPGPVRSDGTFVGRSAPEIDVIEAIVDSGVGHVRGLLTTDMDGH